MHLLLLLYISFFFLINYILITFILQKVHCYLFLIKNIYPKNLNLMNQNNSKEKLIRNRYMNYLGTFSIDSTVILLMKKFFEIFTFMDFPLFIFKYDFYLILHIINFITINVIINSMELPIKRFINCKWMFRFQLLSIWGNNIFKFVLVKIL